MIYLQNPTIPSPTDPIEIDRAIQDLQIKLANSLVWLSHSFPRAYPQIEATQQARTPFVFPSVYLGKANNDYKYTNVAPDNDKTAQCFFLVDTETINDFVRGEHNLLSYRVSIIFTANLKLVNDTQLATEIFQANLIQQVREVLTREITLTPYDLSIVEVSLLFRDVYREFQLQNAAVLEKAPFTHFRFECDITLQEECNLPILNRCDALKNNIQGEDDLICLLSLYDFSNTAILNALSPTQTTDLQAAFCTPCPQPTRKSTVLDGLNESIFAPYDVAHELERTDSFTIDIFVKISAYKLGAIIGKFDYQGIRRGYVLWTLADGRLVFELASNESTGNTVTTITINPIGLGAWKRLTVTYTGTSTAAGVTMYIDKSSVPYSVFQSNLTGTTVDNSNILRIGGNDPGAFAGKVYAAKIWKNRALTPSEVAALPIETDTTIYQADLICWQDCGTSATFGSTVAVYPDRTGITTGYQSVNTEASDFDTDVPT